MFYKICENRLVKQLTCKNHPVAQSMLQLFEKLLEKKLLPPNIVAEGFVTGTLCSFNPTFSVIAAMSL